MQRLDENGASEWPDIHRIRGVKDFCCHTADESAATKEHLLNLHELNSHVFNPISLKIIV